LQDIHNIGTLSLCTLSDIYIQIYLYELKKQVETRMQMNYIYNMCASSRKKQKYIHTKTLD
jgi:hypothetical protein